MSERYWTPPLRGITICIDPDAPQSYAIPTMPRAQCGDEHIGGNEAREMTAQQRTVPG